MDSRLRFLSTIVLLNMGCSSLAQQFPSRPVRFVLGFPAGGPTDAAGRIVGPTLSARIGQPVVIDNRPGADGAIGPELVAKATPDGHTLLLGSASNLAGVPAMRKQAPYDTMADFAAVTFVNWSSLLLVIHPGVPAKTLGELIAHARANPGKLMVAAANPPTIFTLAQVKSATVISYLDREVNAVLKMPDVQDQFGKIGFETGGPSRQEFPAFLSEQLKSWAAAARDAGMQPQ